MNILILGAGQVGSSVAANLASEANDITLVDTEPQVLNELRDRLDIQTVTGPASHPRILQQAGIEDTDMLIAVTNSDETNMVACQVAHSLFHTPTKIARVRSAAYLKHRELFSTDAIPVDVLISPEQIISSYVHRLIEYPGALQVLDFADGKAAGRLAIERLGELHSRKRMNITPDMFPIWVDCLMATLSELDPEFTPELEQRWRQALQPGIDRIKQLY